MIFFFLSEVKKVLSKKYLRENATLIQEIKTFIYLFF